MTDLPPAPRTISTLPSWLLGRAAARGHRLVGAALAGEGVRMPHHATLAAIAELGPIAQADLGRSVRIDPKDMVLVLNDLQRDGRVDRVPDPRDRRRNTITITPAGRELLRRLAVLGEAANDDLLAPLNPAERAQLVALLVRVVDPEEPCAPAEPAGT